MILNTSLAVHCLVCYNGMPLYDGKVNSSTFEHLGVISLKLLRGELAPKLVYFVLKKELLNFSEIAPWIIQAQESECT